VRHDLYFKIVIIREPCPGDLNSLEMEYRGTYVYICGEAKLQSLMYEPLSNADDAIPKCPFRDSPHSIP
jgi:hypothetical protein